MLTHTPYQRYRIPYLNITAICVMLFSSVLLVSSWSHGWLKGITSTPFIQAQVDVGLRSINVRGIFSEGSTRSMQIDLDSFEAQACTGDLSQSTCSVARLLRSLGWISISIIVLYVALCMAVLGYIWAAVVVARFLDENYNSYLGDVLLEEQPVQNRGIMQTTHTQLNTPNSHVTMLGRKYVYFVMRLLLLSVSVITILLILWIYAMVKANQNTQSYTYNHHFPPLTDVQFSPSYVFPALVGVPTLSPLLIALVHFSTYNELRHIFI